MSRCHPPVSCMLLMIFATCWSSTGTAATFLYNDTAPYYWESATNDVNWERRNTSYPVDDDKDVVNIGFNFPFAGTNYNQVRIISNGILQFGNDTSLHRAYSNAALDYRWGDRSIYVYWDDLNPARGGTVRYSMQGVSPHRYFVVSWENLPNYDYTGVYNLQVILYEDGEFKLQYGNGNATGDSATIGVQVDAGDYTEYSFNQRNSVDPDTAIVFYPSRAHFSLGVQSSADLCRGNAVNVTVTRHDSGHGVDTGYVGTVTLSTTTAAGTWANVSGVGTLVDLGGGVAQYQFSPGDRGQAVLQFVYTDPVITGFHVNDGSAFEHHAEDPYLTFEYGLADNAADDFSSSDYVGSTGTLDWSTDWTEVNEFDGAGNGDTAVVNDGGSVLRLQDNDGGGEGVYREVDLSGYPGGTLAILSFDYRRSGLDRASDYAAVSVSANGGTTWHELDRFAGPGTDGGYQSTSYDISGYVGARTRIRFLTSGSMGGSDRVYIDNVDIGLRTPTCGIDHYAISHGTIGVTCEASAITVAAHDSGHGQSEPGAGVEVTVTAIDVASGNTATDAIWSHTGGGAFVDLGNGRARYTFADNETDVQLWLGRAAGGAVNIDVLDSNGSSEQAGEDADLDFRATALKFYADGVVDGIATQLAGKSSSVMPGAQSLTLRAVETNSESGACQSRFSGPVDVDFAYECVDPSSCANALGATLANTAIPGNAAGNVASYQSVGLTFDVNGYAPVPFQYDDTGSLILHARASLPASGEQPAAVVSGASNSFVVAPAGLCVEATAATAACASGDVTCSIMGKAGASFDLSVRAVAWESAGESGSDFCSGNATTPNFRLNGIGLSAQLEAPGTGVAGSLGAASVNMLAADAGDASRTQSYSEVGVFRVTAQPPAYLGVILADSQSANIGRQVPDHFSLTGNSLTAGCGIFTYMDQPALGIDFALEARNAAGNRTQNYRDAFAKGDATWVAENANDGTDLGPRLSGPSGTWNAGALSVSTANAIFMRDAVADGPFDSLQIGVKVDDNDGNLSALGSPDMNAADNQDCALAANCDAQQIGSTQVRYGRVHMLSAHGSELLDLDIPLRVESYKGANVGFDLSVDDSCTVVGALSIADIAVTDGLVPAETCVWDALDLSGLGCVSPGSPASQFSNSASAGLLNLDLSAPGSGNTGVVSLGVDVPDWLEFDWNGAGAEDPTARATFGIFNRRSGVIYQREVR